MPEVSVKKVAEPKESVARKTLFEMPFFRGNLFPMNPFALMRQFAEEMDKSWPWTPEYKAEFWAPTVEVKRANGNVMVTAELPGLTKDNVKISISEDALILEGERKLEKEEKGEEFFRSERSYGQFYRSIPLPEGVNIDKTTAEFIDGVLKVSVPCAEVKPKVKEVPITESVKAKVAA